MSYNFEDFKELENLSEEEKNLTLDILKQLSNKGESKILDNLIYQDYEEIPVDIETFLKDKKYLGNGLIDSEGRFTVFPFWLETLKKIFPNNLDTAYNTLVLTGGIGLGKSFMAVLCQLYLLYRMICLKDPYLHYGLQPIDKITFSLINITIEAAKGVAWDKMQQLLQTSPWFMEHGTVTGRSELIWNPPKGLELVLGSSNNAVIGRALFSNFTDEVNFAAMTTDVEKIKRKQRTLITQVDARMQSRFMKGNKLPTLQIIASSKNSDQSFLESYISMKKQNESKTTLVIDEPQWVVRNDKDSPDKFCVAVGNKFLASEVLPKEADEELINSYRSKGYSILKVPSGYYEAFVDNVEIALTDIAGISTIGALKYISGAKLNDIKTKSYKNAFVKDIIEVGTNDDIQYSNFFDLERIPKELKNKPLFIHLDMSKKGDKTGIAGVWIDKKVAGNNPNELYFKAAFSVSIKAPKGYEISFEKNRNFIRWLRDKAHLNIKGVSSDTFQSVQIQQQLKKDGFNTIILSVDRLENIQGSKQKICLPYQYLRSCIYEKKLELYDECPLLTEEIVELEKEPDGHINHPDNGTSGSKDQVDALCIHGETEIYTLSGNHRNIKTLYEEYKNGTLDEWVLSYNIETNQIEPVKIQAVIDNGIKNNLIKLTLDTGESLICTRDHKILQRNGEYIEAENSLQKSLMPFTFEKRRMYGNRDYDYIYIPNKDLSTTGIYTHKLVANFMWSDQKKIKLNSINNKEWVVIHHKDCNRFNNRPENLEFLTNSEHSKKHYMLNSSELKRQQLHDFYTNLYLKREHPFQKLSKERRSEIGRESIIKLNKSKKHRIAISNHNKVLAEKHLLSFQLNPSCAHTALANKKRQETCIERYGDQGFKSKIIQQRCKESCLRHFGYDNPFKSKFIQDTIKYKKLKNAYDKVLLYFHLEKNSMISLFDFKVGCYALNLNGISYKENDIKAANLNIDCSKCSDKEWNILRDKGTCVRTFLKTTHQKRFTYESFKNFYYEKIETDPKFKYRFKFLPTYKEILTLGFDLYNHRVIKIEKVDAAEVYDLKLDRIHNFALTSGLFVHNCGSIYNASLSAERFEYDYGESISTMVAVSSENSTNIQNQIKVDFEKELQKMFDPITKQTNQSKPEEPKQEIKQDVKKEETKNPQNKDAFKPLDFGMGPAKPYKPSLLNDGIIFWG